MLKEKAISILGLVGNPSPEEIKKAYRKLALECHPDRNKEESDGKKFKLITEAYECLLKPKQNEQVDPFEFFESMQKDFAQFFGHGFSGGKQKISQKKSPCESTIRLQDINLGYIPVNIAQLLLKDKIILPLRVQSCCKSCLSDKPNWYPCKECNQSGKIVTMVRTPVGNLQQVYECQYCHSTGWIYSKSCNKCRGKLVVPVDKGISIIIPDGFTLGSQLVLDKAGNEGWNCDPSRVIVEPRLITPSLNSLDIQEIEVLSTLLRKLGSD